MKPYLAAALAALLLVGCDFGFNPLTTRDTGADDAITLPGTDEPSANRSIERYEAEDGEGSGYASAITYDAGTDTFTVDNLAFDGDNTYARDDVVPDLGPFRVYENDSVYFDDVTGDPIPQYNHKAIFGESASGNTRFAIVRTGAYVSYGFGGFVYARDGGVDLPTTGQAAFTGAYAGLRDFAGQGGLEYVTGDMRIDIDFDDFNDGAGVSGTVTGRRIFDLDGNDITGDVTAALGVFDLPVLNFTVASGVTTDAGEMSGGVTSYYDDGSGETTLFESGSYYAVISGDSEEIVGVIVVEAEDPRVDGVTVRETGGFILYR